MWRQNTHGRLYAPGKPLSKDLRTLIINKIILDGGDPATGVFAGRFTDIARPLNVSSAVVSNVWKRFWTEGTTSPKKHAGGHPRHLSEGDLHFIEHLKENKPSITHEEIIRVNLTSLETSLPVAYRHQLYQGRFKIIYQVGGNILLRRLIISHRKDLPCKTLLTHNYLYTIFTRKILTQFISLTNAV